MRARAVALAAAALTAACGGDSGGGPGARADAAMAPSAPVEAGAGGGARAEAGVDAPSGGAPADAAPGPKAEADARAAGLDAGPDAGGAVPLAMVPALAAAAICERIAACCTDDERAASLLPPDRPGCEMALLPVQAAEVRFLERSVAAGRAGYDGAAFAACLERLRAQGCAETRRTVSQDIFSLCAPIVPRVAVGGACQESFECVGGYCKGATGQRPGTCAGPRKKMGQDCDDSDQCESGFCDPDLVTCQPPEPERLCE
jgi:hypothetical protein